MATARLTAIDFSAAVAPTTPATSTVVVAPAGTPDMTVSEDWDLLFCAVLDRLRLTVGADAQAASAPEQIAPVGLASVRVTVLECVQALDLLHAALLRQRNRCESLVEPDGHAGVGEAPAA
ncbi:hypothetical protein [Rhodoferax sp.]|uniref:hypothetical protein n=1 Tax=Rhodoferax sp. TaxID=50421 RepID=UPI00274F4211|nr:hypothetical protein [Rhodoferax sp.]